MSALVAVHARASSGGLGALRADELDRSYAVNTRSTLLLVQAAARAGVRRVVFPSQVQDGVIRVDQADVREAA